MVSFAAESKYKKTKKYKIQIQEWWRDAHIWDLLLLLLYQALKVNRGTVYYGVLHKISHCIIVIHMYTLPNCTLVNCKNIYSAEFHCSDDYIKTALQMKKFNHLYLYFKQKASSWSILRRKYKKMKHKYKKPKALATRLHWVMSVEGQCLWLKPFKGKIQNTKIQDRLTQCKYKYKNTKETQQKYKCKKLWVLKGGAPAWILLRRKSKRRRAAAREPIKALSSSHPQIQKHKYRNTNANGFLFILKPNQT